jgi:DNA-binding CsgD family transcriptional regulator
MTQQRAALAEVMDRLPAGVFLLNDEGRVVLTSRSAVRILDRRDGVFLSDGGLRAGDARADEILRRHVAAATSPPPDAGRATGGTLAVPRTSDRAPYPVSVSRLLPGCPVRDAVVAVIVMDPETGTEPAVELLRSVHGLTPAEADLVSHLVRGRSLEQAARARGTSVHTVRGHLKQVFSKTGTHRQGELVQLVLRCFVPMGEE